MTRKSRTVCILLFLSYTFLTITNMSNVVTALSASSSTKPTNLVHTVAVVGGVHGNEYTGIYCIKQLQQPKAVAQTKASYPSLDVITLLGNPKAYLANRRFIDTDLNREFLLDKLQQPQEASSTVSHSIEAIRAREINQLLGPKQSPGSSSSKTKPKTDVILDLHSTTSNMGVCLIIPPGDALMAQAAAYVRIQCGSDDTRVLVEEPTEDRPFLESVGTHGFTIEVGPVPQSVLRHDAVKKTNRAVCSFLEFLEMCNSHGQTTVLRDKLNKVYPGGRVPCFAGAGKIPWPCVEDNPNFPAALVHESLQDQDFELLIRTGDPLFVALDGSIIPYDGSHGDEFYPMFVNEGGYYYSGSGTGIGVACKAEYDLETGLIVSAEGKGTLDFKD